ncbi:MAG: putative O-glycosylation ligase, exosortase A system-associated [Rubrivivax sp.]|nr:putative O-glycosylation ligase, exosortase A system-associated [Rubrivivax sp.]
MRDILLTTLFGVLLLAVFKHPYIGPLLWAWMSLMNPHRLTYGFAQELPFAMLTAVVTMVVALSTRQRQAVPMTPLTVVWLLFLLWMSITSLFALNQPEYVFERWLFVLKIQVMVVVTIMLVRTRAQVDWLIWVVALSIAFYGIKGGVWTLATGGAHRVWGPAGSMVEDNNSLAVALIMVVPFLYYLYQVTERRLLRVGLVFAMITVCLGVLGSQSRGALLGIVAMATLLGLKSRYPLRISLGIALLLAIGFMFMPDSWTERMNTMKEYKADESAMSRLYTWHTLWNLALDRPFVGGGFRSDFAAIFQKYAPTGPEYEVFQGMYWVAHSIYFQVLGEHGFVAFGLFVAIGLLTWRRAGQLAVATRGDPEFGAWVPKLMPMVQAALIGYAIGGAFLSLAYFDLPYYLVALVLIVEAMLRESRLRGTVPAPSNAAPDRPVAPADARPAAVSSAQRRR